MKLAQNILVAVDLSSDSAVVSDALSPSAKEPIEKGTWLASSTGATLTLLAVLRIPKVTTEDLVEDSAEATLIRDAENILTRMAEAARERGVKEVHTRVTTGVVWQEVIEQVLRNEHDLVIAGTKNRGRASRLLFGSNSVKLLRKCPCPVWIARPGQKGDVPMILVADDFTDVGTECLFMGVAAAQLMQARLLVIHAIEFPFDRRLFRVGTPDEEIEAYRVNKRVEAEQELYDRLSQTDWRTIDPGVLHEVVAGPADVVIENAMQEHGVDLLIMGTVGREGVAGVILGNTAEQLLPAIDCSLLAIKPDNFVCPVKLED